MIRFLKEFFVHDLQLKLISLALAIALWATVASVLEKNERERGETMSSNKQFQGVPVAVVYSFGDASGFKVKPAQVTVFIQGTREAIDDLAPASLRASVDLRYWDSRENLPLQVRVFSPPGTAVVSWSPMEVEVIPPEPAPPTEPPDEE